MQDSAFVDSDSVNVINKKSECNRSDFTAPLNLKMDTNVNTATHKVEMMNCSAAKEIAIAVSPKRKMICSGSLIAVRKRMIDNAPTNPKLSANDDFMVVMIRYMDKEKNRKLDANSVLLDVTKA